MVVNSDKTLGPVVDFTERYRRLRKQHLSSLRRVVAVLCSVRSQRRPTRVIQVMNPLVTMGIRRHRMPIVTLGIHGPNAWAYTYAPQCGHSVG